MFSFLHRKRPSFAEFTKRAYDELVFKRRHHVSFWVLASFIPTFVISRVLVYTSPNLFLTIDETHVHHFTYGIFLLAITGYLALVLRTKRWESRLAVAYGIGLALSFDEFGMWLHLTSNYFVQSSYDAILIVLAVLISLVYFSKFWLRLLKFPLDKIRNR
jgi:hypothetical protein